MFFERQAGGEKSLLVHIIIFDEQEAEDAQEFFDLAIASGVTILKLVTIKLKKIVSGQLITAGKLQELKNLINTLDAELILFNHLLTPTQEKNLEIALKCRVADRTGLILNIFAKRALSHEARLQIELAQLQHLSTRLVKGWTHLERQKGGTGLRGPGETQLESDRRIIKDRIIQVKKRLAKFIQQRCQNRKSRQRAEIPHISLIGYTNTGKSQLFNTLTTFNAYTENQLFATLDPKLRSLNLKYYGSITIADTVGFIRHLPHQLIKAFRATLEESSLADLLLHVVDANNKDHNDHIQQVNQVLQEINADKIPQLLVYNKIDLLSNILPKIERDNLGIARCVKISALQKTGIDLLKQAITERLTYKMIRKKIILKPLQSSLRARFYNNGFVISESFSQEGNSILDIRMPLKKWLRWKNTNKLNLQIPTNNKAAV